MGDIQEYFIEQRGAEFLLGVDLGLPHRRGRREPDLQLAFTLANGFTFVEAYLARGMKIDDFAPNLSFFFSYGMDPEYAVLGRVARRIWAVAMKKPLRRQRAQPEAQVPLADLGPLAARAGDRVQRHPHHAAGADLDLRQHQLAAHQRLRRGDHHADRGIGAPRDGDPADHQPEWGLAKNENPNQGCFVIDELTDLVEEAVLKEFEAISSRGGVLGAMETGYQRGKIQEESLLLRAQEARRLLPDHRRQHLPQPARRFDAAEARADPLDRGGEAIAAEAAERFSPTSNADAVRRDAGAPAAGGDAG